MAKLELVNALPRMKAEGTDVPIYDETIIIVSSGATPPNELNGPITTGTDITLPNSQTYTDDELEVRLNGQRLESVLDYNLTGSAPRTQISLTFDLVVGDQLRLRIDRNEG